LSKCLNQEKKGIGKSWLCAAICCSVWVHRTVRWCTGQCPVRQAGTAELLSGIRRRRTAIIHRTVWWCTGLSGEPTAARATVGRAIHAQHVAPANGRLGAPDCPVCTGLSGVHRTVRCAPDCPVCTGLSGVHRTVSGAPTATILQRSNVPF
jgi:hypothetical protein